jgi:hypothetical protein
MFAARPACAPSRQQQEHPHSQPPIRNLSGFGAKRQKIKTRQWGQPGLEFILLVLGFRLLSRLRGLLLDHAFCLRTLLSLNNFELDVIAFLEALITLRLDGTVMDEHIGPIIPANKAEALCVIEPFHFTFDSRHVPYSLRSPKTTSVRGSMTGFLLLVLPLLLGGRHTGRLPVCKCYALYPLLWL